MAEEQQFCLRWNNFQANITTQFEALRNEEDFVDVTLACDGQRLKAHKVVLSACSPYFKELFRSNPCKHPILFLRDVEFCHLQSLVQFMYAGEVNVAQAQLSSFLRTAESLQIRGLTESPQRHHKGSHGQKRKHLSHNQHHDSSPEDDDDEVLCISSPPSSPPLKNRKNSTEIHDETYTKQTSNSAVSMEQAIQLAVSGQRDTIHHRQEVESFQEEGPEIFEPKVEVPDYTSDGDSKADNNSMSGSYIGLDNSVDINSSVASLHGGMEILAGSSNQNFIEVSQDLSQADLRKLHSLDPRPCPICFRMYSNLSNLRQHVRLIHNPQTVVCPLCNKPFKTKLYLKRHLMGFHEVSNVSTVKTHHAHSQQEDFSSRIFQPFTANAVGKLNISTKNDKSNEKPVESDVSQKDHHPLQFPQSCNEGSATFQHNDMPASGPQHKEEESYMYQPSRHFDECDNQCIQQNNRNYCNMQPQSSKPLEPISYISESSKMYESAYNSNNNNNTLHLKNCNSSPFHGGSDKPQEAVSPYPNNMIDGAQAENSYTNCLPHNTADNMSSEVHISHFLSQGLESDGKPSPVLPSDKCHEVQQFLGSELGVGQDGNTLKPLDNKE